MAPQLLACADKRGIGHVFEIAAACNIGDAGVHGRSSFGVDPAIPDEPKLRAQSPAST
jgi:hypothetical protein